MISGKLMTNVEQGGERVREASALRCVVALCEGEWRGFFTEKTRKRLAELFPVVIHSRPDETSYEEWAQTLRDVDPDVILSGWSSYRLPPGHFGVSGNRLRYICHLTGQVRSKVDREELERGLIVTNWGNSIAPVVAEHALLLALAGLRRLSYFARRLHGRLPIEKVSPRSLFGRRVGIHGFGRVARELLRLLTPFQLKSVMVHSPQTPEDLFDGLDVTWTNDLETLFSQSDVVFELEGLNERTAGIVTGAHLRALPNHAVFVNCGRAGVVDENALVEVAREGRIQIALDVFHTEPLPMDSPLRGLENVTLTPHIAGPLDDTVAICGNFALDNLHRWVRGEEPLARISLAHYDNMT